MLQRLRHHPLAISAHLKRVLVLTYAAPQELAAPLLPQGLTLDTHRGQGFLAIALVQTEHLRPSFLPEFCGLNFTLAGVRLFARLRTGEGRNLRGLYILRSAADRRVMEWGGNVLTRYRYRHMAAVLCDEGSFLKVEIVSPGGETDLRLTADLSPTGPFPPGQVFQDEREARRFAGPLPYTFSLVGNEAILVEGVRENWNPRRVRVDVERNAILGHPALVQIPFKFASAFYVEDVPYHWKRGVRVALAKEG